MRRTNRLGLPIFDNPNTDKFGLDEWNYANETIDEAYDEIDNIRKEIPKVNANAEVVEARKGNATLGKRIDSIDENLKNASSQLEQKANTNYVDDKLSKIGSAKPSGAFETLLALKAAYPNGDDKNIYVVSEDNNWYYWNGTTWIAGGLFNATVSSEFPAKNLLKNSNFLTKDEWSSQDTTLTVSDNTLIGTGLGNLTFLRIFSGANNRELLGVTGNKVYGKAFIKIEDDVCNSIDMTIQSGTVGYIDILQVNTPLKNVWHTVSNIVSLPESANGINLGVAFHSDYASATEQLGKKLEVKYPILIDLTATFGKGLEPTKEEMDLIMEKYPNMWFDGTKSPLIGQKELYLNQKQIIAMINPIEKIEYNSIPWGNSTKMHYAGHRGFPSMAPESSIPGYNESGKAGHTIFEADINSTSDGKFIIMHDFTIDRTTNGVGNVKDLTLSQIKEFNIDTGVNIELYPNLKVPTLEEYLSICRKWGAIPLMQIDKLPDDLNSTVYNNFLQILKNYGFEERCMVAAIDINRLNKMRKLSNKLHLQYLISYLGTNVINTAINIGNCHVVFNKDSGALDQNAINYAHQNGVHIAVFTVNDRATADTYLAQGVDMIITDTLKFEA